MSRLPISLQNLVEDFERLPGVGPKSALRMAFSILHMSNVRALDFAKHIEQVKSEIKHCKICHNISQEEVCSICSDEKNDRNTIMVVERVVDLLAFDKLASYSGTYHVLGGVISPISGIGPEELNIFSLKERLRSSEGIVELIIATSPTLEGEATAIYLKEEFAAIPEINITRIARGLPSGADLDYTDRQTLLRSLQNRSSF